jgi:hypothetical protein
MARRLYQTEPDFEMSDVPVRGIFGMDVTRCVVTEFLDSLGMAEFCQRAIRAQDAQDAAHRCIDFERRGRLAGGGSRCDFRYRACSTGAR